MFQQNPLVIPNCGKPFTIYVTQKNFAQYELTGFKTQKIGNNVKIKRNRSEFLAVMVIHSTHAL